MTANTKDNDYRLKRNLALYKGGKTDFTTEELYELKLYILKLKDLISTTEFYEGSLKSYKIVSCFADDLFTELQDYMLKKYNGDVAIIVFIKERKVILKSDVERCKIDICTLAKLLCDGSCTDATNSIAEGRITDKFLNFTKTFKICI